MKSVSGLIGYSDKLDGWDEYYLDITKSGIKPIMKERIKLAREKNCDGIEADNLDVCSNEKHLDLSTSDCVEYAKWLANTAHSYDISIGLKNSKYIADKVASYFDFAINESCFTHGEYCHSYKSLFLDQGKAVFSINYNTYLKSKGGMSALCKHINGLPISMIVKETQSLVQAGWIVDSSVCGSSFDNGIRKQKTTVKKATTTVKKTTTTVKKTTTTTVKKITTNDIKKTTTIVKPTTTVKPTTAVKPTTTVKPITTVKPVVPTQDKTIQKNTPVKTPEVKAPVNESKNTSDDIPKEDPEDALKETPKEAPIKSSSTEKEKTDAPVVNAVEDEEKGSGSGVTTGVAVTGSVLGAAGVFLLLQKKNPKQYQNLKRSLSQKASTVKRGATNLSRRATERATTLSRKMSRKNKPETAPQTTIDPSNDSYVYQFDSYRYQFTQNLDFGDY